MVRVRPSILLRSASKPIILDLMGLGITSNSITNHRTSAIAIWAWNNGPLG